VFNRDPDRSNQFEAPQSPRQPGSWQWGPPGTATPNTLSSGVRVGVGAVPRQGVLTMSFVWMFLALLVSGGAALFVASNTNALRQVAGLALPLLIAEFVLVFAISGLINRIGALPALGMLFVYAVLNGLVLGLIVWEYTRSAAGVQGVVTAFAGASAIFGGAAVYGVVTRRDLTRLGGILFMGLIGILVVSFIQLFFFSTSSTLSFVIGIAGVVIFTGLTAVHVQSLQRGLPGVRNAESASVIGALLLYLDFINLFLMLLRVFGGGGSRS
jgi:FtsH-binding integral membrane protein